MKRIQRACWTFLLGMVVLLIVPAVYAQNAAIEKIGDFGYIDWVGQKVVAKGIGAPPQKYYGKPQARPMAMRAATTDARRNLLEVVKGVHIDSTTTVQNFAVADDTIIARVQGVIRGSTPGKPEYMSDGTVEITVSMPLSGQLSQTILQAASGAPGAKAGGGATRVGSRGVETRIRQLENRVRALEQRLAGLKKVSDQQSEMFRMLGQLLVEWRAYDEYRLPITPAAYATSKQYQQLKKQLDRQQTQIEKLAARLATVEGQGGTGAKGSAATSPKSGTKVPFTGLVIDARKTGFRPCLMPGLFSGHTKLYPGSYIKATKALRSGYVRYYRKTTRAQQSARVGKLPLKIKATGTYRGKRNLKVSKSDFNRLKKFTNVPGSFMQECKVVIVF